MLRKKEDKNIALGKGVFKVDGTPIGLTRDGGSFIVEREYRLQHADGDRGAVKGRIRIEKSIAKLTINHLEVLTEFFKLHPGLNEDKESVTGSTVVTGTGRISLTDYHLVEWDGETNDGRELKIELEDAINLENINWDLKDKDDIIDKVTYEATYDDAKDTDDSEKFKITYKNIVA